MAAVVGVAAVIKSASSVHAHDSSAFGGRRLNFEPRRPLDTGGFFKVVELLPRWGTDATLEQIGQIWKGAGYRNIAEIDDTLSNPALSGVDRAMLQIAKATFFNFEGEPNRAYEVLTQTRSWVEKDDAVAEKRFPLSSISRE